MGQGLTDQRKIPKGEIMFTLNYVCRRLVNTLWILVLTLFSCIPALAAHSGKNGRIAFLQSSTGTNQIYTVNPDGTGLFQVTNFPPSDDVFALWPDVSPDGKRILFSHDMTGAMELYVINADGTGLTQITHDGLPHVVPHWSPDGTHIVFNTFNEFGGEIATVRADGTDFRVLSSPVWDSLGAQYTGDGKHIVFSTTTGGYVAALWIMDTNGKHQKRLTAPVLEAGAPDVSADGKEQVVFYNHQNTPLPTSCVFKMNLDGTGVRCLTGMSHVNTLPVFSPDGTKILYMSDRLSPGFFDTFVMDTDGSHKKRVIPGGLFPNWGPQP